MLEIIYQIVPSVLQIGTIFIGLYYCDKLWRGELFSLLIKL